MHGGIDADHARNLPPPAGSERSAHHRNIAGAGRERTAPGAAQRKHDLADTGFGLRYRKRRDGMGRPSSEDRNSNRRIPPDQLGVDGLAIRDPDSHPVLSPNGSPGGQNGVRSVNDTARGSPPAENLHDRRTT